MSLRSKFRRFFEMDDDVVEQGGGGIDRVDDRVSSGDGQGSADEIGLHVDHDEHVGGLDLHGLSLGIPGCIARQPAVRKALTSASNRCCCVMFRAWPPCE